MAAKLTELPPPLLDAPVDPRVLVLVGGLVPVAGLRLLGERDCMGVLAGVDEPVPDCPDDPDGAADPDVPDVPDDAAAPPELTELAGVVAGTADAAGACACASSVKGSAE